MNDKRQHRCCFTGHRPNKLDYSENEIKPLLETAIDNAISDGYVTFITGMAEGVDIWAAEIVLEKKKENKDLHLICAVPHPGFEKRRSQYEKERYEYIIKNAERLNPSSANTILKFLEEPEDNIIAILLTNNRYNWNRYFL